MLQQQLNETEEKAKKLVALSNNPSFNNVESTTTTTTTTTNYGSMTTNHLPQHSHKNPTVNEYNHKKNDGLDRNTAAAEEEEEYVEDFYGEDDDDYTDDEEEDEFEDEHYHDDSYSKSKQNKCFHCCETVTQSPGLIRTILSPFRRVGKIMYDAILLISDVDDVWEIPAMQQQQHHPHSFYDVQNYSDNHNGSHIRIIMNQQQQQQDEEDEMVVTTRHKLRVVFWFLILIIGYATERSTFKILMDRTGPFRLAFGSIIIPSLHAIVLLTWMIIKAAILSYHRKYQKNISPNSRRRLLFNTKKQKGFWDELCGDGIGLPILDVGFMGFLDSLPLLVVSITGNHVAPIMTVILVQFTIPLTTLIAQFAHPEGKFHQCRCFCRFNTQPRGHNNYNHQDDDDMEDVQNDDLLNDLRYTSLSNDNKRNNQTSLANTSVATMHNNDTLNGSQSWGGLTQTHVVGSAFMFISIILAIIPSINSFSSKPLSAWNTLLYLSSCIFAAISQTYKEEVLLKYKSPIDSNQLNISLSICTFFSAMVFCPMLYILQGLGTGPDWTLYYPPKDYSMNIHDTYQCLSGGLDQSIQQNRYHEVAHCDYSWLISILHVLGILSIGLAVDKITNAGAIKIMYHGLSGGIIAAICSMFVYQVFFFSAVEYGFALNFWHVICSIILILGSEIYHRVSLEEPMFETVYPDFSHFYYDDANDD